MDINNLSYQVIGIAMKLHRDVGPGLLESAYEHALAFDLREAGFEVKQQLPLPFIYKSIKLDIGYRIDLLVENQLILEIKSVETIAPVHLAQTLTYLKLSDKRLGLLINFNTATLKDNIHRIANRI
jgi:GxxExxY protein